MTQKHSLKEMKLEEQRLDQWNWIYTFFPLDFIPGVCIGDENYSFVKFMLRKIKCVCTLCVNEPVTQATNKACMR